MPAVGSAVRSCSRYPIPTMSCLRSLAYTAVGWRCKISLGTILSSCSPQTCQVVVVALYVHIFIAVVNFISLSFLSRFVVCALVAATNPSPAHT